MEIQKFEYLENQKSFLDEIKKIFHSFWNENKNKKYLSVFSPNAGKYGPEKTPYWETFHTVLIKTSNCEKPLGIKIDYKLTFDNHVNTFCKKTNNKLKAIAKGLKK